MGSGCGIGGTCVAVKATHRLDGHQHRPLARATPSLFAPNLPGAVYTELTPEKAGQILHKWQTMCGFKQNARHAPANGRAPVDSFMCEETVRPFSVDNSLLQYASQNPKKFAKLLAAGPPEQYRWAAWKAALRVSQLQVPGLYQELSSPARRAACVYLPIIVQDRDRTFAEHIYSRVALENVLAAYSVYDPEVGYCQGMNYVAGFLLIVSRSNEEETFWALAALMKRKVPADRLGLDGVGRFYTENFPLIRVLQSLFDYILELENNDLKHHLSSVGLPNSIWLQQWISSLFLYSFPLSYCLRFWDALLACGISFLLPLSLVIVDRLASQLLRGSMDSCYTCLKTVQTRGEILHSPDELIWAAHKLRLDWKALDTVREEYQAQVNVEFLSQKQCKTQEETKSRVSDPTKTPQGSTHPTDEDPLKGDDFSGAGESIRKSGGGGALLLPLSDNKSHSVSAKKEEFKLPPIKKSSQFVFEFDSDILEGSPASVNHRRRRKRGGQKYTRLRRGGVGPSPFTPQRDDVSEFLLPGEAPREPQTENENLEPEPERVLATENREEEGDGSAELKRSASNHSVYARLKLVF